MSGLHLPERCGVMLLPDCTLFPHGALPLRIFEPRYRQMLADAIEGPAMFAVVRLLRKETADPAACCAGIGTIGLVRASREMPDGTSNLLLHGVIRVRFRSWLDDKPYPCAQLQPIPAIFEPASQAAAAAAMLRETALDAVSDMPGEIRDAVRQLLNRTDDPVILTDIVAQQFLQNPDLRQQVLEIESPAERVAFLCRHLASGLGDL